MLPKQSIMLFISAFTLLRLTSSSPSNPELISKIDLFLQTFPLNIPILKVILESGKINGNFDTQQTFMIFDHLTKKHPQLITKKTIGTSFEKRAILAYYLSQDQGTSQRSKSLMVGGYHARELSSVHFLVGVLLQLTHNLIHLSDSPDFWQFTDVILIPTINIDSHTYICDSFDTANFETAKQKRKNMNNQFCM